VEELLAERGIAVDHVTIYRWVQRFTPLLIDAARPCRHVPGDRWFVDETYVKVSGRWVYLYRAIDQYGQVIDVLVSQKRDLASTRQFFTRAFEHGPCPTEINTDRAPAYPRVIEELIPAACHVTEHYRNNSIEADHGRLPEGPITADAQSETAALSPSDQYRTCVRPESPSGPLRTRPGHRSTASAHNDLRRTRPRHLIKAAQRIISPAYPYATEPSRHPTTLRARLRWRDQRFDLRPQLIGHQLTRQLVHHGR
jgi:hypothetical protein